MLPNDHLELTPAGDHAWRVTDKRVPEDGPAHIVASIDAHDEDVEVLWIRGAVDPPGTFPSLASALDAVDEVITRETRGTMRARNGPHTTRSASSSPPAASPTAPGSSGI